MKLQFDSELSYQRDAVSSVVDLFRGQTPKQSNFTVSAYSGQVGMFDSTHGIGNKLELNHDEILANLNKIQLKNGIAQTTKLTQIDFDIEMETGTGKTYVYLRSIFELHKAYGFSKFIIVVPSIAIKEGVYKSLQITKDHFNNLYDNTVYDYFVYNSSDLEQVRSFAVNNHISIMVINIDAFRKSFDDTDGTGNILTDLTKNQREKSTNIIHRQIDKLNGMKPIELIRETKPFVIIDEPQSVDSTPKSKEAIKSLSPLVILRYSATHVEKHSLIYKLDAVDSFEMELVKQIEVAGFESVDYHNQAYMLLKSVDNTKSPITAKIEIDANVNGIATRKVLSVRAGSDLYDVSKGRELYSGYIIDDIYCEKDNEYVSFSTNSTILRINKAVGGIDDITIKEQQIRKTIEEHLNKELILTKKGIKVLSLFFIDRVKNYRYYDNEGNAQSGVYAKFFEKHYNELMQRPKYEKLKSTHTDVSEVHNGYFSIDKSIKTKDNKQAYKDSTKTSNDETAYNLIMKDKEKLLSFDTELRFIFSHSALREGWDSPNVFQICTLNETHSEIKKRQEIGRGLRLCVNQDGERQYGFDINTLTVMANESYEKFASTLQREYEKDEGIRFGIIERHSFANITIKNQDGDTDYLGAENSELIYKAFEENKYIDKNGAVQDKLKNALKNSTFEVPVAFLESKTDIFLLCKKISGNLNIKSASDKRTISLNKQVYLSDDFKSLWDKIKYKTTYKVEFDSGELIEKCCTAMKSTLLIKSAKLIYSKVQLDISASGVNTQETVHTTVYVSDLKETLPDVVTYLQNRTNLTRKTIVDILIKSETLDLFKKNPQRYMEDVARIITSEMKHLIVDGIKYTKLGDSHYYAQELFDTEELTGYLERNMIASDKSVYSHVVYDSNVEKSFAEGFEANQSVKVYAKLPNWFKIATPIGSYNPDWAVMIEDNGQNKLYFVVETKGTIFAEGRRQSENDKIDCGKKHFKALGQTAQFATADNFKTFLKDNI